MLFLLKTRFNFFIYKNKENWIAMPKIKTATLKKTLLSVLASAVVTVVEVAVEVPE